MIQTILKPLIRDYSEHRYVSDNPFVVDVYIGSTYKYSAPNWALIIPLAVILIAAIITVSILLYRNWRKKNCCPIYFAGKVRYARMGLTIQSACQNTPIYNDNWITDQKYRLKQQGYTVVELYADSALTVPLDKNTLVTTPVYIYPKIEN